LIILEILYLIVAAWLAVYGFNALYLTLVRRLRYKPAPVIKPAPDFDWPAVTVQLPVYNERFVAERLITAVAALDYPADRLQIQVLDDSDDITTEIIARLVARARTGGVDIRHIQRPDREGYKGGALQYGLKRADGEFIAIFDADFLPEAGTLKSIIPHFEGDLQIGCIQTRWSHINPDSSWLTRSQAAGIDGHFLVQQETRSTEGLFLNFNGTGGVWRRDCIEDAGGWQGDTLTEDLDLSYRAQLLGWRILYLPHVSVPGELPVHIGAFKRQQFRWAKGSIQTARKLLVELWRSRQPLRIKLTAAIHLTNYIVHPLILLNLLLTLPVILSGSPLLHIMPVFTVAALGPILMYWFSIGAHGKTRLARTAQLGVLLITGMGLSINNSRAVLEALLGIKTSFLRTPKFNVRGKQAVNENRAYTLPIDPIVLLEIAFAVYSLILLLIVLQMGVWRLVLWLPLYIGGFSYVAGLSIYQSLQSRSAAKKAHPSLPTAEWLQPSAPPIPDSSLERLSGD